MCLTELCWPKYLVIILVFCFARLGFLKQFIHAITSQSYKHKGNRSHLTASTPSSCPVPGAVLSVLGTESSGLCTVRRQVTLLSPVYRGGDRGSLFRGHCHCCWALGSRLPPNPSSPLPTLTPRPGQSEQWLPRHKPELQGDPGSRPPPPPPGCPPASGLYPSCILQGMTWSRLFQKVLSERLLQAESKPPALMFGGPVVVCACMSTHG